MICQITSIITAEQYLQSQAITKTCNVKITTIKMGMIQMKSNPHPNKTR